MVRLLTKALAPLAAAIVLAVCGTSDAKAQDYCRPWQPDLFYNYYVAGAPCPGNGVVPAQLYVSPRPTPPMVGHTWITYQPLLPQEYLYRHHRWYFADHCDSGLTVTRVCWW
jgi:hypothetical protein